MDRELNVAQIGQIVGVSFAGEIEAILFVPQSGDVLTCGFGAWEDLVGYSNGELGAGGASDALRDYLRQLDALPG